MRSRIRCVHRTGLLGGITQQTGESNRLDPPYTLPGILLHTCARSLSSKKSSSSRPLEWRYIALHHSPFPISIRGTVLASHHIKVALAISFILVFLHTFLTLRREKAKKIHTILTFISGRNNGTRLNRLLKMGYTMNTNFEIANLTPKQNKMNDNYSTIGQD